MMINNNTGFPENHLNNYEQDENPFYTAVVTRTCQLCLQLFEQKLSELSQPAFCSNCEEEQPKHKFAQLTSKKKLPESASDLQTAFDEGPVKKSKTSFHAYIKHESLESSRLTKRGQKMKNFHIMPFEYFEKKYKKPIHSKS